MPKVHSASWKNTAVGESTEMPQLMNMAAKKNQATVKRRELKYYLRFQDYVLLSGMLRQALHPDPHNPAERHRGYMVRSVYFDTLDEKNFYEKLDGIETRHKYRLRIYGLDDRQVKFEIKSKHNTSIMKETLLVSRQDALRILERDYAVLLKYNQPVARRIYAEFSRRCYRPVVLIDYEREAYTWPANNFRVTFDRHLYQDSLSLNIFERLIVGVPVLGPETVVMEVKFEGFVPQWIAELFRSGSFTYNAISKYCLGRMGNW